VVEMSVCLMQDHLLQWMLISVSEPEKRTGSSSVKQDTYVVYLIECKYASRAFSLRSCTSGDGSGTVWRES